jgi:hypothetical protein
MTVANNYVPARYVGNGSTVSFAVDWRLESADDFVVYQSVDGVQTVVDPSEYTTVNTSTQHGVVFNTAPADGTIIVITRETPQEQDTPYKTSSGFQAEKVEEDFDSLTMMVQELQQDVDRAVKVDETETITPEELRDNLFTAAENATAAATAAQASAAAAAGSELNARTSENTAAAAATNAQNSANYAIAAEENARAYSVTAEQAKRTAESWATDAGTAATNAQRAAEDASSQATAAAASRASASQSATAAADDASTARQKAAEAAASATAAEMSATTASTSAASAVDAQSHAATSAYNAGVSATEAAQSATDARNAQSLASSSATAAYNSEVGAIDMYNRTRDYASTASTAATNASTSETNAAASATLAQNWATKMDGTVDGTDYSAKYYASQAGQSVGANINLSNLSSTGEAKFTAKQDVISDLSTIRSGAALGATAVQPADLATVATTGAYSDLSDTPNLSVYAADNAVVHLAGAETITGTKTFTGNLIKSITSLSYSGFHIQNTQVTKGTMPSPSVGGQYMFQDKDGLDLEHRLGGIETAYGQDGIITRFIACEPVANSTTYSWIGVIYPNSGSPYTYAPASDVNRSILTTVNKSKSSNGYFQLGNGLIIQWGTATCNSGNNNISFPTAFSNTNYRIVSNLISSTNNSGAGAANSIYNKSTTGCIIQVRAYPGVGIGAASSEWLAIGY